MIMRKRMNKSKYEVNDPAVLQKSYFPFTKFAQVIVSNPCKDALYRIEVRDAFGTVGRVPLKYLRPVRQ